MDERTLELDVYLPNEALAFEYQGEQHYSDIYIYGYRWMQRRKDEEKREMCMEKGITLIEVPYWWDGTTISLEATIKRHKSSLVTSSVGAPVPDTPGAVRTGNELCLMHGLDWDGQQDLTGWWLSEKLDGMRAHWNGKKLLSRHGEEVPCPNWFVENLPSGIRLDGEIWLGRGRFEDAIVLMRSGGDEELWKSARFVVFDMPHSTATCEDRMRELRSEQLPAHVEVISSQLCLGKDHLCDYLNAIVESQGEGLMAIRPQSCYITGEKTECLLKVKMEYDCELRLLEVSPKGLHCIAENGKSCMVGCFQSIIDDPPTIGSIVSVKHLGYYQDGSLRNPFYWRASHTPSHV